MGYNKAEIDETTKDMESAINRIDEEINEFSENSDMEKYLDRLPEVLLKTFELASNAVQKREIKDIHDDVLKLLELTTFELTVNNKKELKVKLFDVLDRLISSDNCILEAPSGVEPDYGALQAPA
jgi:molecular chaperone DnaK (HSP70)